MDFKALLEPKKSVKSAKPATKAGKKPTKPVDVVATLPSVTEPTTPTKKAATSSNVQSSPTTPRAYDPRALLNPRGAGASKKSKMDDNASASTLADHINSDGNTAQINGNYNAFAALGRVHNVEKREPERLVKRQKLEHNDEEPHKTNGHHISRYGNAGMGEYFKPQENGTSTGPPSALVDLTQDADDDDDDVLITGSHNRDDEVVCFGMLDAKILMHTQPRTPSSITAFSQSQWPIVKTELRRPDREATTKIECFDSSGQKYGNVEENVATALAPAMDAYPSPPFRTQCKLLSRPRRAGQVAGSPCSEKHRALINVYGRRADVVKVGRWFGQKNIWFRQPMTSDPGIEVCNPHSHKKITMQQTLASRYPVVGNVRTVEETNVRINALFDEQTNTELEETEAPELITTELLPHQKQALTFMLDKERPRRYKGYNSDKNSSLWTKTPSRKGKDIYEEVVSGIQTDQEPPQMFGGLLADVMGLGKTIEALTLVAATAQEAKEFAQDKPVLGEGTDTELVVNSRATLLIVPVSTVKNWEDQIVEHIKVGTMQVNVYHGTNRMRDLVDLADNDIVITTYGTVASEIKGKNNMGTSLLKMVQWFRIILDEAHTIRESKSMQAQAIYSLHAQRRWALTGTPIQNRMEDLASLCVFLRLYPFDSLAKFKQYIQGPAQSGDTSFLRNLRVFIDSFTLRRNRDRIELPKRQDLIAELEFSFEERKLHDFFRAQFSVVVTEIARSRRQRGNGGQFHRVLEGITILRLICDHGRELLKSKHVEDFKGNSKDDPVDLDDESKSETQAMRQDEAYAKFKQLVEYDLDICCMCGASLTVESPGSNGDGDSGMNEQPRAYMLSCSDVWCPDCFQGYGYLDNKNINSQIECASESCMKVVSPRFVAIPRTITDSEQGMPDEASLKDNLFKNGFYNGPHTKTLALLNDLAAIKAESQALMAQDEPPIKSIIFSEFTSHLDLIERALSDHGYSFVRIDGSMSLPKRRRVLDLLNNDDNTTILLASIKAAGQGLNLTAASRAFIMEPMWNPQAEAQAVDRIYRIGQKREVVIKRYRMKDSIEDKIVALQEKKKKLAEMSMEKAVMQKALSKKEKNEQSLKAMLEIFKS